MVRKNLRKRRRPTKGLTNDVTIALACCSIIFQSDAFTIHRSVERNTVVLSSSATTVDITAGPILNDGVRTKIREPGLNHNTSSALFCPCHSSEKWRGQCSEISPWFQKYVDFPADEIERELISLEYLLLEQGFIMDDIRLIVDEIRIVANGNSSLKIGIIEFLNTVLSLDNIDGGSTLFISTPVLRASIIHYANSSPFIGRDVSDSSNDLFKVARSGELSLPPRLGKRKEHEASSSKSLALTQSPSLVTYSKFPLVSSWNEEVDPILNGAENLKRVEELVQVILKDRAAISSDNVRNLLLSMMADWRSLGIRVVTCLYRLERVLEWTQIRNKKLNRTPEVVHSARVALRIYAPLAQRLGMLSLKSRIESTAFRILYCRQYEAASFIYKEGGELMHALASYLRSDISTTLGEDEVLLSQLERFEVVSRVKEPYSFWRKLLKNRSRNAFPQSQHRNEHALCSSRAIALVKDGIALRVIITAKKLTPTETDNATRAREAMLCYYVHSLIRRKWPEVESKRVKDYIAHPKENGYQSLHHTSKIMSRNFEFPFEVQVRTEEMHRLAEFGLAAHWDYKLGKNNAVLQGSEQIPGALALVKQEPESKSSQSAPSADNADSFVEALVVAKEKLAKTHVHVFVVGMRENSPCGDLVALPLDSPIETIANEIDEALSARVQVWKNGRIADRHETLDNGDVVLVAV